MIERIKTSEVRGRYSSKVRGYLHETRFPSFKFEAWRKDSAAHGKWKAAVGDSLRDETITNAQKFGEWWWKLPPRHRLGSAGAAGLVTAFGLNVGTAIISGGKRLVFSGRPPEYINNAYNEMEGIAHSSELRSQMREQLTDFGSGWQHGTTVKAIRSILKDMSLKAKVSKYALDKEKGVWMSRIGKDQVSFWSGRLHGRKEGIFFNFPSYMEKTAGAEITSKTLLIHKDIPIRMAESVVVPSHPRMWQRIFENAGLGHIQVKQRARDAASRSLPIKTGFSPPSAIRPAGGIAGKRYSEVKAGIEGGRAAMQRQTLRSLRRRKARTSSKLVSHNTQNAVDEMYRKRTQRNIVDDIGKNLHLFNPDGLT